MDEMGNKGVYAICDHNFCATCIVKFIRTKHGQQVDCPYCRRALTILVVADENGPTQDEL